MFVKALTHVHMSVLFEKMKCIFSIAPVGKFGQVAGVFLSEKHSPDAEAERPVCCGDRVKHRTVNTGRWGAPVHASGAS